MHIIMGASGHVGTAVIEALQERGEEVRAITRSEETASELKNKGIDAVVADAHDLASLTRAFQGGHTAFIITPETGQEDNVIESAKILLQNYRTAIEQAAIPVVVGISSIGADQERGTGNLQVSYLLEHTFVDLPIKQIFIRPAYYMTNWMPVEGILPSFFPEDFKLEMVAPEDVGQLAAEILSSELIGNRIYELRGAAAYSAADVAEVLGVKVQVIPRDEWAKTLREQMHFSKDAIDNFIEMTDAVLDGRVKAEGEPNIAIKAKTTLASYFSKQYQQQH